MNTLVSSRHWTSTLLLKTQAVMLATGRSSNTRELNLEAAGIVPGNNGLLAFDGNYQVVPPETRDAVPGIYAAGDVIGAPALAATSMEQARYAMVKAFQLDPCKKTADPNLATRNIHYSGMRRGR